MHGDAPNVDGRSLAEVAAARRRDAGPGGRRPDRDAAEGDGRPRDPARQPRARGLRREARRPRAPLPPRPGARLRLGGGVLRRGEGAARSRPGDVVVIRYEGPAGGPGMREMLHVTAALVGEGLGDEVALDHRRPLLRRDARADGRPRRARGGARRPDRRACATATSIELDVEARELRAAALRRRDRRPARATVVAPPPRYTKGVLARYAAASPRPPKEPS